MLQKCKECNVEGVRVWSGRKSIKGRKIYVDIDGKWWNGYQCPTCKYKPKVYETTKQEELLGDFGFIHNPLTFRKCRKCKNLLPKSSYFYCVDHTPKDDFYDIYLEYGVCY